MKHFACLVLVLLVFAGPASAQQRKAAVVENAPIYLQQDPPAGTIPLRTARAGTILTLLAEEGDWAQVQFQDPQWGLRTGWIRTASLKIDRPELEPMDLSVKPGQQAAPAQPPAPVAVQPVRQAPAETVPMTPGAGPSQEEAWTQPARRAEKGWLDVNVGFASAAQDTRETNFTWMEADEPARFSASYKAPTGADFDFGGGVMFTPFVGAGLSISGTAHQAVADVSLTVPHPRYYNHYATDSTQTDATLQYTEGAVHLQLMANLTPASNRFRARVFGGPTYFVITGDALTEVRWNQAWLYTANEVDITGTSTKEVTANTWGFHVGADVSYFFSRVAGIGALLRVSRGSAKITDDEVMADEPLEVKVGGVQAAFGLRLRFGKR